jgi:hypothetical protein
MIFAFSVFSRRRPNQRRTKHLDFCVRRTLADLTVLVNTIARTTSTVLF